MQHLFLLPYSPECIPSKAACIGIIGSDARFGQGLHRKIRTGYFAVEQSNTMERGLSLDYPVSCFLVCPRFVKEWCKLLRDRLHVESRGKELLVQRQVTAIGVQSLFLEQFVPEGIKGRMVLLRNHRTKNGGDRNMFSISFPGVKIAVT